MTTSREVSTVTDSRVEEVISFLYATLIAGLVIWILATQVPAEVGTFVEASELWCSARGGDLYNARVVGPHGGLHCVLPNGTSVHMDRVIGR